RAATFSATAAASLDSAKAGAAAAPRARNANAPSTRRETVMDSSGSSPLRGIGDDAITSPSGRGDKMAIELMVNGNPREVDVAETTTLLETLRNHLGLMGTRYGCGLEQCGA